MSFKYLPRINRRLTEVDDNFSSYTCEKYKDKILKIHKFFFDDTQSHILKFGRPYLMTTIIWNKYVEEPYFFELADTYSIFDSFSLPDKLKIMFKEYECTFKLNDSPGRKCYILNDAKNARCIFR